MAPTLEDYIRANISPAEGSSFNDRLRSYFSRRFTGVGSPEGVVTAFVGSQYTDNDTGLLYLKTSGSGNTGWTQAGLGVGANNGGIIANGPIIAAGSAQVLTANQARGARVTAGGTITKIGIQVTVQSGNICVGVYTNTGSGRDARPAVLRISSGSVACPAVGYAEVSLGGSVALLAGEWFAFAADNATAAFVLTGGSATVSELMNGVSYIQAAAFPLPNPAVPATGSARVPLMIGVA